MTQHDNDTLPEGCEGRDAYGRPVPTALECPTCQAMAQQYGYIETDEIIEVYRLLLDADEVENAQLRAENTTLRAWCVEQILKTSRREH